MFSRTFGLQMRKSLAQKSPGSNDPGLKSEFRIRAYLPI